jgi:hypothetical protein
MQESQSRHASWQELLASPAAAPHVVQICDNDEFLVTGVAFFAAEGLRAGEAVLLTGTHEHVRAVQRALDAAGADAEGAARRGQLVISDAGQIAAALLADPRIDALRFDAFFDGAVDQARAAGRFTGLRWWAEIAPLMRDQGRVREALRLEELADLAVRRHGVRLLCSYRLDRFDPAAYGGFLEDTCCRHSHVIPAEDYVRHRLAVNRAIAEVLGEIRGPLLQSLLSWKGLGCDLPSSQALLFWVRETLPERFEEVLSLVKAHQLRQPA